MDPAKYLGQAARCRSGIEFAQHSGVPDAAAYRPRLIVNENAREDDMAQRRHSRFSGAQRSSSLQRVSPACRRAHYGDPDRAHGIATFGGMTFGSVGAYEKVVVRAFAKSIPASRQRGDHDIQNAPLTSAGW